MEWIKAISIVVVAAFAIGISYHIGNMDGRIEGLEMASRLLEEMFKKEQEDTDE